jgi:uroporphyrinogen decarboxylase
LTRAGLPAHVPLIGFCGSPFTLFSYLVAGKPSKEFSVPRAFAQAEPEISAKLMDKLADAMIVYLKAQAGAGAQALMLFESWGGLLGPTDYARVALPHVKKIIDGLKDVGVPIIYFANQCGASLASIATLNADVIGLDWRTSLGGARKVLGPNKAVQGNLDPAHLFSSPENLRARVDEVLADAGPGPGHIFNLGHGIWPETDPDSVARLVDYVHEKTAR